jgi:dTDP-4-amino-4,6-dideoxygalactose transaminase
MDAARWYSNFGPLVCELEAKFAAHLSAATPAAPVAVATMASGYAALIAGLQVFRLPPGAKVLIPAVTFPACPLAVRAAGYEPVLADIDPHSWTLTPEIARKIAARGDIAAVMPVALYGVPVPVAAWDAFMDTTGLPVLIDAAAAFDAQPVPHRALAAYSLHATKPFGIGEGGLLAGRDAARIDAARTLSNFGTRNRITIDNGLNAKLSEYHAAVGLAQFARWPLVKQRRRAAFALYTAALVDVGLADALQPGIGDSLISSLMLKLDGVDAATLMERLQAAGVSVHRTYLPPLYAHPQFARLSRRDAQGADAALLAGAETVSASVIGLPFHGFLDRATVDRAVDTLDSLLAEGTPQPAQARG